MLLDEDWDDIPDEEDAYVPPEELSLISDPDRAAALLAKMISTYRDPSVNAAKKVRESIDDAFASLAEYNIDGKLEAYKQMHDLCDRLGEWRKLRLLKDTIVVGFGGQFSAGKSRFINAITGIDTALPVNQSPTTSIPTYVLKSCDGVSCFTANTINGRRVTLDSDEINALTHQFYEQYQIGFSSFLESIIVSSAQYKPPERLVLLDTPGYSKADLKASSKNAITDRRKSLESLCTADFIIWLIDINNGVIKQDDIEFIRELRIKTPILIVFNKADLKTEEDIQEILQHAKKTVEQNGINCYGITAYSSAEEEEYGGNVIDSFFQYVLQSHSGSSDILTAFQSAHSTLLDAIHRQEDDYDREISHLQKILEPGTDIVNMGTLTALWSDTANRKRHLSNARVEYALKMQKSMSTLSKLVGNNNEQ